MEIIASCYTDAGTTKKINQDALSIQIVDSPQGKIVMAVVCDGVGGLKFGERASREMVQIFHKWFTTEFARMVRDGMVTRERLFHQWQQWIDRANYRLKTYAKNQGKRMGTTLSVLLICCNKYYICHVGDSRIYQIDNSIHKLTTDHTLVAQEVAMGRLTKEQAQIDSRRNVLLQCVGASEMVKPQFDHGSVTGDVTFLLSSDGFVHQLTEVEIYNYFYPKMLSDKEQLTEVCKSTTKLLMERGESDNITVVAIVYKEVGGCFKMEEAV